MIRPSRLYLYIRKIECIEILSVFTVHFGTGKIYSYKIVLLTPYRMTKFFEFVNVHIGAVIGMYVGYIFCILWKQYDEIGVFSYRLSR